MALLFFVETVFVPFCFLTVRPLTVVYVIYPESLGLVTLSDGLLLKENYYWTAVKITETQPQAATVRYGTTKNQSNISGPYFNGGGL